MLCFMRAQNLLGYLSAASKSYPCHCRTALSLQVLVLPVMQQYELSGEFSVLRRMLGAIAKYAGQTGRLSVATITMILVLASLSRR